MRKPIVQPEARAPEAANPSGRLTMRWYFALCGMCLVTAGCAASAAQAPSPAEAAAATPPPYSGPTIPKLLGCQDCIKVAAKCTEKVCTCLKQQFPGPGAAAPNLGEVGPESSPAAKCAAEIIAADAKAPQTIDALRYLGRVGCTKCYPCVEEGLLAALDDCTESVRYEAAKALRRTFEEECNCCQYTSCCSQKVYEKLYKVAYETNSTGCPVEPSERVRRVARQGLQKCCGPRASEVEPTPTEGPSGAPVAAPMPAAESEEPAAEPPAGAAAAVEAPAKDAGATTAVEPIDNSQNGVAPAEPKVHTGSVTSAGEKVSSANAPAEPLGTIAALLTADSDVAQELIRTERLNLPSPRRPNLRSVSWQTDASYLIGEAPRRSADPFAAR